MAIIKGFNLYVVDSDLNIIADVGTVIFPALNWTANMTIRSLDTREVNYTYFDQFTPDSFAIGNAISDFRTIEKFQTLQILAPLALRRETMQYAGAGYYLMLGGNSSGYYAVSQNTLGSQGTASGYWSLYDNEGNSMGRVHGAIGFPCSDSTAIRCFMPHNTSGEVVTSTTASVLYIAIGSSNDILTASIADTNYSTQSFVDWYNALAQRKEPSDDPYSPDGESEEGGGHGDFDGDSDSIDIPDLPDLSAVDTGFITLFNPSIAQLQSLANYMWSSLFDLDTFKKLFADPMSCILGLSIVPVNVPSGGTSDVTVGNIPTGVSMTKASRQYVAVDCGTINVNEYWGAYLDYDPYTKAEIYLPYIGTHPLAVDDIMNKAVHVVYHVDVLSGACIAYVKCGNSVLYSFIGQCASSIPITGNDWTNVINGVLSIAGAVGTMVATGGASAPISASMIASTAVNTLKPSVEKSGSLSGTGGIMGIQVPYLILTRPRQALPKDQNKFIGYPSFINVDISSLSGYTEIESIHLDNVPATDSEINEIESILKSGVIF